MELIPSIKLDSRSIASEHADPGATSNVERLVQLSSWMMALGTIRVICAFADSLSAFVDATHHEPISWQMLVRFVEDNHPIVALCAAWPLLLGIALRRSRWPELLTAAGVTFLILSFVGLLELTAEWNRARGDGLTLGSFHLTRRAFLHPTLSDMSLGLLGAIQLVVECTIGARCLMIAQRFRAAGARPAETSRQDTVRRARFGRLAVYASLGFLVVMIRLPVWSTYLELLNESTLVREFVLKNDVKRINPRVGSMQNLGVEPLMINYRMALESGARALRAERFLEAKDAFVSVISRVGSRSEAPVPQPLVGVYAEARNNLAWLLATCPETAVRDPKAAVENAMIATELEPNQGTFWNTLGVAYYRDGKLDDADRALRRSMELRSQGDSFDWFFLAIVEFKKGHRDEARDWYDKAVSSYQKAAPFDRELHRFHAEAARELGLPEPPPQPVVPAVKRRYR
jgi:hypothetical protein